MRYLLRHRADRRALRAFAERQELVKAGLTRRDLVKMGLMTTGGSAADWCSPTRASRTTAGSARCRR